MRDIKSKRRTLARWRFGLLPDEFEELVAATECAICKRELPSYGEDAPKADKPHIDHCSDTGTVRGILCFQCNVGIGSFSHNTEHLKAAIEYLNTAPNMVMKNLTKYNNQARTHCGRGHELTPENTYVWSGQPNKRACKICRREANRRNRT